MTRRLAGSEIGSVPALLESLPARFRADRADDWTATFHFTVTGAEPEEWTVRIERGRCEVVRGHEGAADCTVRTNAVTYLGLEAGTVDPQMAVMTGRVRISNLAAMSRFAKCFDRIGEV